jgi:hypothetical protein
MKTTVIGLCKATEKPEFTIYLNEKASQFDT